MPSIAQQDYIVIKTSQKRYFYQDAEAMSKIVGAVSRNTLFDCLIENIDDSADTYYFRPVGYMPKDKTLYYYDATDGEMDGVRIPHSESQYQGLAAVQQALDAKYGFQVSIPELTSSGDTSYLQEGSEGRYICVDNKYLIITGDETVTALTIAETGPGEGDGFVNITWEDAQKLIGLPLA